MSTRAHGEPFYLGFGIALFVLVAAGFVANPFVQTVPAPTTLVLAHAIPTSAWYVLLIVQPLLVQRLALRAHIQLGLVSIGLAVAVVVTGLLVALEHFREVDNGMLFFYNVVNILQFAILYWAAMHTRKQPEAHKRYMAVAGIVMTPPALVRLTRALGWGEAASLIFLFGFFAALLIYDRRQHGKFHPANLKGLGLVVLGIAFGPLAVSDWWGDFARSIFGK